MLLLPGSGTSLVPCDSPNLIPRGCIRRARPSAVQNFQLQNLTLAKPTEIYFNITIERSGQLYPCHLTPLKAQMINRYLSCI